ncbi:MAG: hypothetical protein WA058_01220 [Minisyncoccia bacterium]
MDIIEQLEKAHKVVVELCDGTRKWIMHIPADVERDPDLIIGGALREAQKEIAALRSRAENVEAQLCAIKEASSEVASWSLTLALPPEECPEGWLAYSLPRNAVEVIRKLRAALSFTAPCRHAEVAEKAKDVEGMAKALYENNPSPTEMVMEYWSWEGLPEDEKALIISDARALSAWLKEEG